MFTPNVIAQMIVVLILGPNISTQSAMTSLPQARFSIQILHEGDCIKKGEPVVLDAVFINETDADVGLITNKDWERSSFEISVIDPHGKELPRRSKPGSTTGRLIESIIPGGKREDKIGLSELFALDEPGTYKVQIARVYYLEKLYPGPDFDDSLKTTRSAKSTSAWLSFCIVEKS